MPYSGSVRAETQILSYTWGGGICRGCLGANAQWFTWQTHLTDWFSFDWCKTKRSEIAYFCYEAHQRKTYGGCLRVQRQILSYTRGGGMCESPLNANALWLTCQTDHTDRFWVIQCSWNCLLFSWTTANNALRWPCEGPETNSFIYLGLGHVWGYIECQWSVAKMSDRPYRQVLSHPMQLKLLIFFMDISKECLTVAIWVPRDTFFHKPGLGARAGVSWLPLLGGLHVRQTLQTGVHSTDARRSGVK